MEKKTGINYTVYNETGFPIGSIRKAYIVKFVDPEKEYTVDYNIKPDGTKERGIFTLKGKDLTENQIWQLFLKETL